MENFGDKHVYHGSPRELDADHAIPKRNVRGNTEGQVIFDEESFHATPHKWIALAYTYTPVPYELDGKTVQYNMGVNLYENTKEVAIFGFHSLKESLGVLYGNGGYLYHFDKDKFIYKEGLGNSEVIISEPTKPITVEQILNPVEEMKKLGVTFDFIDLALPENKKYWS